MKRERGAMSTKKIAPHEVPNEVMGYILDSLQRLSFGEVVLVAQDGVLVQVEWSEKLRTTDILAGEGATERHVWEAAELDYVAAHVRAEFRELCYGRLVIVVKRGAVVQIERTEKQRFTGMYGEGI